MPTMKSVGWTIVVLSFASLASAQVLKTCSAPPKYPHTSLRYTSKQSFREGDKVYYDCAEDFSPSKGSRAAQCAGGKWTKLTLKCEKISCGNAGELLNGHFHYEGSSLIGEKVYAICNEGYTLKGLSYMICKKFGWTGEFPSCEEEETSCSSPVVANSVMSNGNVSVHRVGDSVTFTCSRGFQLDGAQQISCGFDGQWQPQPPRCLPSPDKTTQSPDERTGDCDVPPSGHNSMAKLAETALFASGARVEYMCDIGYVATGGRRYRTCRNGKWTPLHLRCERKLCGSAGEILNGQFTYTGVEFGDAATAVCDEGYILVGRATRHCLSNGWDGRVPVCEAVTCEEPPEVTNAEVEGLKEPPYTYSSVLRYRCRVGALTGQREISCTKNGTWSAPPPKCKETSCPTPNVRNASWRGPQNFMYQFRETISVQCNRGYIMTGPRNIYCDSDGQWKPSLPACKRTERRTYIRNSYTG